MAKVLVRTMRFDEAIHVLKDCILKSARLEKPMSETDDSAPHQTDCVSTSPGQQKVCSNSLRATRARPRTGPVRVG